MVFSNEMGQCGVAGAASLKSFHGQASLSGSPAPCGLLHIEYFIFFYEDGPKSSVL